MSDIWTTSWSETDGSNNQTPPEGWPAGMFPNAVEPAARMNMGALKRTWNRLNPVYSAATTGTDVYTVSPSVAFVGYGLHERLRFRFQRSNNSTSTSVIVSSLPAQFVRKYDGAGNIVNPAVGDIQAQDHELWWDGTQFILTNPAGLANTVKTTPTSSDSVVIKDAASSNALANTLLSALLNTTMGNTGANGFISLGGISVAWGQSPSVPSPGQTAVTFVQAFPNSVSSVLICPNHAPSQTQAADYVDSVATTGFVLHNQSPSGVGTYYYLAIGK